MRRRWLIEPLPRWRGISLALLYVLTSGCSPLALVSAVSNDDGVTASTDRRYGMLPRQQLDIYSPKSGEAALCPVVIFFYGGSWQTGERGQYRFVGEALAAQGFIAVVPDYRVYPEVKFPTFVEDGAAAVRWVHDHILEFGGDPRRVFLMGHSAGAHIAAMLALDPRHLAAQGLSPEDLRGFIGLAGPYDFLPLKSAALVDIFGGADGIPDTQPITFVSTRSPPALLLHGADDTTVRPGNSDRLSARMRQLGGSVSETIYKGIGHSGILLALSSPFKGIAPVRADVAAFVRADAQTSGSALDRTAAPPRSQTARYPFNRLLRP